MLGTFARSGIEAELGADLALTVHAALCHYTGKLQSGRPPIAAPQFFPNGSRKSEGEALELSVDPDIEALLEGEAMRQGIDVDALATHSVLVYLAELDFLKAPSRPV